MGLQFNFCGKSGSKVPNCVTTLCPYKSGVECLKDLGPQNPRKLKQGFENLLRGFYTLTLHVANTLIHLPLSFSFTAVLNINRCPSLVLGYHPILVFISWNAYILKKYVLCIMFSLYAFIWPPDPCHRPYILSGGLEQSLLDQVRVEGGDPLMAWPPMMARWAMLIIFSPSSAMQDRAFNLIQS